MSNLLKKSIISSGIIGIIFVSSLILSNYFVYITIAMMLAVIWVWKYVFDVKLKPKILFEKSRFLVLPMIFNVGALYLTTIFFQTFAKSVIVFLVILANYFLWISLRKVHNLTDKAAILHRNILIILSFMSVFLGSTTIFRLFVLLSTTNNHMIYQSLLVGLTFLLFYLISSFLIWENGADEDVIKLRPYVVATSLLGAEIAWVSSIWIVNYPVITIQEKANLGGTPLPAILLTIVFYFLWGIIFHKLDNSLTRRVLTEYILITVIFILVLLATARWLPTL